MAKSPAAGQGRGVGDIDPIRLAHLNAGGGATTTLTESLAVDFAAVMRATLPDLGEAAAVLDGAATLGITKRMALAAGLILERLGPGAVERLAESPSDTLRGWACFVIGQGAYDSLAQRLRAIRPFADDGHFGVREWSWLALRPHIAADPQAAIAALVPWTAEPSDNVRRFACEATRPRGVWCAHIAALKKAPEQGLPILEPLRADAARYVQDSVGNWLNDAGKDQPAWLRALCDRWRAESPEASTLRICARASRSLDQTA
ncbi:DNA alkylation repair protein [Rhodospirillum rubrum]|uniref:DNA alkylation repair protein n=1 Tax=Rhodospirillum rubrum (strain ATCC 11170 / ATH 1.1.1 / DSM 467 / LMG 4362 / NCIMB 8255 / S1) TaxID=269796 RepID=Q2RTY5_RHORT|nr:DNA alkylation repair protein [Rhodospirillum rubrum]ABC22410.1 conserved hypothetical protein [Rhodospirillum rubrum ATCC 11170]AEO48127.1 hypothetical protein F11_08305 [Rhodospirillum rubrum F11]MBK5953991.1 DNA alkylation repair protein [Rhodospirillum rubrum]QXG82046.1 DNA alkylation repair protein [Rhodospirillum rubrum]HAP99907.1 DNA alkylation repair protein [Rhodospirillum rubrum]